jgi:HEAT repeat protein
MVRRPHESIKHIQCFSTDNFAAAIRSAAPRLIHLLDDEDPDVCQAVVNVMAELAINGV